jgi:WD40 repeat protein
MPIHFKFSPGGERFAIVSVITGRETLSVYDITNGVPQWSNVFDRHISALNWHPSGRWIAACHMAGSIALIDARTGEMRPLGQHKAEAVTVIFSPDGRYLFSGGWERELICWDLQTMQRAFTIGLDSFEMQFRIDGRECAINSRSGLQLYAVETPAQREFPEELGSRLRRAEFSPDGRWLAASGEKQGAVWDLPDGGPGALVEEAAETHLYFTPNGSEMFGSSGFRWRITPTTNAGAPPQVERLPLYKPEGYTSLCLISNVVVLTSSNGAQLLAPQDIEAGAGNWARTTPGLSRASPDSRWLGIYLPYDRRLYVYALPGLEAVAKLTHPAAIGGLQFVQQAQEVAIYSRTGIEFWSTVTWERTHTLTNFRSIIAATDQRSWWLTKDFRSVGLYAPRSSKELLPLPAGTLPLAVSPDGRHLAVSVDARRLQLWDIAEVRKRFRELGVDWQD